MLDLETLDISSDLKRRINAIILYGHYSAPFMPLKSAAFCLSMAATRIFDFSYCSFLIPSLITGLSLGSVFKYMSPDQTGLGFIPANIYMLYLAWKYFQVENQLQHLMHNFSEMTSSFHQILEPLDVMMQKLRDKDFENLESVVSQIESRIVDFDPAWIPPVRMQKDISWYVSGIMGMIPVTLVLVGYGCYECYVVMTK